MPLSFKRPVLVKKGQIASGLGFIAAGVVLGSAKVKRILLVPQLPVTRPRFLSKKLLRSRSSAGVRVVFLWD